jgi:phage terminase small subunit
MPVLANPRHERFAQALHDGKTADEAYIIAGFQKNRHNASRLKTNETIRKRVDELLEEKAALHGITKERVLAELGKIAFANITEAVEWSEAYPVTRKDEETGVEETVLVQAVNLKASKDLPLHVTAAISEVRKTKDSISIKFHNKEAALTSLGRHFKLFTDNLDITGHMTLEQLVMQSIREEAADKAAKLAARKGDEP